MSNTNDIKKTAASVLVVDDDASILQFFIDVFKEMNLEIDTEQDGEVGRKLALENDYELIFLDIKIKEVNGLDVLRAVKKEKKDLNIIMISGYLTEDVIEEALSLGADGYLYKPLTVRDILSKTINYLNTQDLSKLQIN